MTFTHRLALTSCYATGGKLSSVSCKKQSSQSRRADLPLPLPSASLGVPKTLAFRGFSLSVVVRFPSG